MRRMCLAMVVICVLAAGLPDPGLVGTLASENRRVTIVSPLVNFSLTELQTLDARLDRTFFVADWIGVLRIDKRDEYTFTLESAGCTAALNLDGKTVDNEPIALSVGEHAIAVHCQRNSGAARLRLMWSSADFPPEPVPGGLLGHRVSPLGITNETVIRRGRLLVESFNCVACHQSFSPQVVGRVAPDLSSAGNRLRPQWIAEWLADPQAFRHGALMPAFPLNDTERADIAAYLATLKDPNNKNHEESSKPPSHIEAGHLLFDTIGCAACHAKLDAPPSQKMGIDIHGMGSKWFTAQLGAFLENPLAVDHSGRMPSMLLSHADARNVAEYLTESQDIRFEKPLPETANAAHGKVLVQSAGCAACHTGVGGGQIAEVESKSRYALSSLRPGVGCLADKPTGKAMRYTLTPEQRQTIVTYIESLKFEPPVSDSPIDEFYHRVATLGCTNCHELNGIKPPDVTDRIPSLTNIGGKLQPQWMEDVLTKKQRVRSWLHRRMPDFGADHVKDVPSLAMAVAGVDAPASIQAPSHKEIAEGQTLLGISPGAFGCITCHGFNGNKPAVPDDTRGPDLSTAAMRLRPDHFRRWVHDPKRVDPSTPMPSFFDGVPLAEANQKIETILRYCALGSSMPAPMGWIDQNNYVVVVRDEARIIRAVLPNLNGGSNFPRGIAVGLPELISYCFDADSCMLRYVWNGAFIDMQASWTHRGGNEVHVMGKMFWGTNVFPLRLLAVDKPPKAQFEGYEIQEHGVPRMLYAIGNVQVKEKITALPQEVGFVREFEIGPHDGPMEFVTSDKPNMIIKSSIGTLKPTTLPGGPGKKDFAGYTLELPQEAVKFSITYLLQEPK